MLRFVWVRDKAVANLLKHGVDFHEAATAFGDPLSITIPDPQHSIGEERWLLVGQSLAGRLVVVAHTERGDEIRIIIARPATRRRAVSVRPMKKTVKPSDSSDDLRPEYDFSGGVRGKYAQRFREGTNIVVLDPDVAAEFKDSQAVNDALRRLIKTRAKR